MIVTLENLKAGIDWWKQANWGMDIINSEYRGIYDARDDGITRTWWDASVKRLWDWKAIRARKPPNTKRQSKMQALHDSTGLRCKSNISGRRSRRSQD